MEKITDRIDAITAIPPERFSEELPAPRSVKIELTGRCNYRCGFCALRMREAQPQKDMEWGLFCRLAGEMREAGVEELGLFFLGESFSSPKLLIDAVRFAKEIGFEYVFLTTNGSLATPPIVRQLIEAGLDSLKFSVNAASPEQFVKVMQVKPDLYWKALENIRFARLVRDGIKARGGPHCGIYASSIRYDGAQQKRMEETLRNYVLRYVDEHYWLPLYSMGSFATQREEELGYRPTAGNQGRLEALRRPLPCWSAFTEGHITSEGKLSACCFDASGAWEMADLTKVSFMEGWNSEDFRRLRRAHLAGDVKGTICQACVAYN